MTSKLTQSIKDSILSDIRSGIRVPKNTLSLAKDCIKADKEREYYTEYMEFMAQVNKALDEREAKK